MTRLSPIMQPLPLAKMAYESLRNSILSGQLKPGEIYNEMALAKELGISRTPVREALLELANQKLVTFLPRKGVMVNAPTLQEIEEIFELRKLIELYAIEKVAKAQPRPDLSKVERALENQRKSIKKKDFRAYMEADRVFHVTFSELTNNQRLVRIVENMRDLIHLIFIKALSVEGREEEVIQEHQQVLEAVKKGNAPEARKALEHHLDQSKEAVDRIRLSEEGENKP